MSLQGSRIADGPIQYAVRGSLVSCLFLLLEHIWKLYDQIFHCNTTVRSYSPGGAILISHVWVLAVIGSKRLTL